jgi:AmmeMemoRadiSam system protein A
MEIKPPHAPPALDDEARGFLLRLARQAIEAALRGQSAAPTGALPAALSQPGAAFVSLHVAGELRGCIGLLHPLDSLAATVAHCARAAALEDPRFAPLAESDMERARIEISVLGAPRDLEPGSLPRIGEDGLVISQGGRQGLLLPQVATEHGWSVERFLAEACRKAGLPPDAWRRGARVQVFSALIVSEGGAT